MCRNRCVSVRVERRLAVSPDIGVSTFGSRYEITRKLAPYVGITYDGKFGGTAAYARAGQSDG